MNNLQHRLKDFSKNTLLACRTIKPSVVSAPLISQLVRSATSVGANYTEAQSGISRKDFRAKLFIALKEAEETKYWLDLILPFSPEKPSDIIALQVECQELIKILQTIATRLQPA